MTLHGQSGHALQARDRLILWIGQPPMRDAGFDRRIDVINEVVAAEAEDRQWVTFVDTAPLLGDGDGDYVDRLPGIDEDLRQGDARYLLAMIDDEIAAVAPSADDS